MTRRQLVLNTEQRQELEQVRTHGPRAYLRERASALLKIADGQAAAHVARTGLLHAWDPDSVYAWLDRYHLEGITGLTIRAGRGRKPAFSPPVRHRARGAGGAARRGAARPTPTGGGADALAAG